MRKRLFAAAAVMVAIILIAFPKGAAAREGYETHEYGSILIDYKNDTDGVNGVAGAVFTAYRIADMGSSGEYLPIISMEKAEDGSPDVNRILEEARKAVKDGRKLTVYKAETDTDGLGTIQQAETGLYVIEETDSPEGYIPSVPFMVSVPYMDEGIWQYDVIAQPKPQPVGTLCIRKTVRGRKADKDEEFHFILELDRYDESIRWTKSDGTEGRIKSGGEVTLKDGEEVIFHNIPAGCAYRVEEKEADSDGYVTTSSGSSGYIDQSGGSTASFINTIVPDTGDSYMAMIPGAAALVSLIIALVLIRRSGKREQR